uniref:Uncharacterized protein n=2 Tax=Tetranychus urticae TaxID=32264 RepID=T1K9X1_TETUR
MDTRPEVMSSKIEFLEAKVDALGRIQKEFFNTIETQIVEGRFEPKRLIELKYKAKFTKKLVKRRYDPAWRLMIKRLQEERVKADTLRTIKSTFLFGPKDPIPFVRKLAEILFGHDRLVKTMMGKNGQPLKGIKPCDRNEFFTSEEEQLFLDLMKLVDEKLFDDEDAFEYLVRRIVNQLGRDLARPPIRLPRCLHFNRADNIRAITDYFPRVTRPGPARTDPQCNDNVINID